MENSPLVTIICLCYNQEKFVVESLNSVLNQNYQNIQLIIVDDCSLDNSKAIIKKWLVKNPEILFLENQNNLGITKSFNRALTFAKGEFIVDLAADDILLPWCIESQLNAFQESTIENLGAVYGNVELISEKGSFESYYFPVDKHKKVIQKRAVGDIYMSVLSGGDSICSVSAMFKKSVYEQLEGYDESLAFEDLDFWIRASRIYKFDFINKPIMQKRNHFSSLSYQFYKKNDSHAHKLNYSNFLVLKKALHQNKNKKEDLSLQKRIHNSIENAIKNREWSLLLLNLHLRLILSWRKKFHTYMND